MVTRGDDMRLLLNCILVVLGIPLFATTILIIAHFLPVSSHEFRWPSHIYAFGLWLLLIVLFGFAYVRRTRWLEKSGIFRSWSNFKAYMIENHGYPMVSEEEKQEFLSWAGLSEERPPKCRDIAKGIYKETAAQFKRRQISEEKHRSLVKGLAWYMTPWPLHDEEDDVEDSPAPSGTRSAP